MSETGTVTIFNCIPYEIRVTVNGVVIHEALLAMTSIPVNAGSFDRVDATNISGEAKFAETNVMEISGDKVKKIPYRVAIPENEYPLDHDVYIYIFNGSAVLAHDGKSYPLNLA